MTAEGSRYSACIDLRDANDVHVLALGRVPANSRVLDLGTADGSVAAVLKTMGCRVWGVDIDAAAAGAAAPVCEEVVVADLNREHLHDHFGRQRFDVILMLDVLEHLAEPQRTLAQARDLVAEGGWAVLSIPNVAHLSVRLSLLEGQFRYTDVGLLDRTHLRFYDRTGVDELLAQGGWAAFDLARVTRRLASTKLHPGDPDPEVVDRLEADPEAVTFQYVISAAPLGSPVLASPPTLLAATAQAELRRAQDQIDLLRRELSGTQALQAELDRMRATKLFRWSAPARAAYAKVRRLR